ncbi:MAG: membrane protein insertase YidC [Bacteroidia bacterium]|nr:membrane protein insertase YidC [Bacteroidia bacterium]
MDRNSIVGLSLIFLIFIGYMYFQQPDAAEVARQKHYQDSLQMTEKKVFEDAKIKNMTETAKRDSLLTNGDSLTLATKFGGFGPSLKGTELLTVLENDNLRITFSNKGGRIKEVELKKHKRSNGKPLILFNGQESKYDYNFTTSTGPVNTSDFYWQVQSADKNSIIFKLPYNDGKYLLQQYTVESNGSSNVTSNFSAVGMDDIIKPNSKINLYWAVDMPRQELEAETERPKSTIYYKYPEEKADFVSETSFEEKVLEENSEWVSFKQQFFNSSIIIKNGFEKGSKVKTMQSRISDSTHVKLCEAELHLPYNHTPNQSFDMTWYFGPNDYKTMKLQGHGMERIVPLGWGIFGWINKWLVIPTFDFLSKYISSFGIIILLLTLIIKVLLFPLVYKSYLSTAKMKLLKPELDKIKEKHGDNMQTAQMDNLKLYKQAGVSPLGGCLPLLLQMPILIAIFQFFPSCFDFRQQPFLWAADLSRYDSILNLGFTIPFYGNHVSLFTLLMTVSTLIYTRMNNQLTGANKQMVWISYLMPIMFLGFFNKYPAALSYYYFLANCITFLQQWAIKNFVDENKLHAQIAENKSKQGTDKKSKFQQKLEDMAKQRQLQQAPIKKK